MTKKSRGVLIALGIGVLCGLVVLGLQASGSDEDKVGAPETNGKPMTTVGVGTCANERGILGGTTCNPSRDQVAKAADIPIAALPKNFIATYEGFQDWILEASFTVPLDQASVYTSLPNYPGATVDGPETDGTGGEASESRRMKLEAVDGLLKVSITVFTT
jgi:hypothetical protein